MNRRASISTAASRRLLEPASSRAPRSTTGICRRRCRTAAAGQRANGRRLRRLRRRVARALGDASRTGSRTTSPGARVQSATRRRPRAGPARLADALGPRTTCFSRTAWSVRFVPPPGARASASRSTSHAAPATAARTRPPRAARRLLQSLVPRPAVPPRLPGRHAQWYAQLADPSPSTPGDLEAIATPTDFLGINYYHPDWVRAGVPRLCGSARPAAAAQPAGLAGLPAGPARPARAPRVASTAGRAI